MEEARGNVAWNVDGLSTVLQRHVRPPQLLADAAEGLDWSTATPLVVLDRMDHELTEERDVLLANVPDGLRSLADVGLKGIKA